MAAPVVVQSSYNDRRDAAPVPTLASNPTAGNLIVCLMFSYVTGGQPATNGWIKGPTLEVMSDYWTVFYRYAAPGDTGTGYGAVSTASGFIVLVTYEISGAASSWASALAASQITFAAAATTYTPPALLTTGPDQLAISASGRYLVFGSGTPNYSAPWIAGPGGSAFAQQVRGASLTLAAAGSTVQPTITMSAAAASGRTINAATLILSAGGPAGVTVTPPSGELEIDGQTPSASTGYSVDPETGQLVIDGLTPDLTTFDGVSPVVGSLSIDGLVPVLDSDLAIYPPSGALTVAGSIPSALIGVNLSPPSDELTIVGGAPLVFTEFSVPASQVAMLSLVAPEPPASRASVLAAMALAEPPPPPTRASQAAMLAIGEVVPDVLASQSAMLILAHGSSCVTERCQIWKITRRDGVVFRFTSHDRPVTYGREIYKSCRSLNPSASENASTIGSVGNIELMGIIDDEGITEADLYGGLFDDAFVTIDLIVWGAGTEAPRRLAAGWTGSLSQGETGFKMEVLGPGARLEQQALVQMVTPGCRWVFGSTQCGVNADALALVGAVVSARTRGVFKATLPASPAGRQWENGRVRWTSGINAGQITETKTVDFATGEIVLWASPGFLPEPGDGFDLIPGCDFNRDGGCTVYANVINFGGFPDLPGADAILETPVAQY